MSATWDNGTRFSRGGIIWIWPKGCQVLAPCTHSQLLRCGHVPFRGLREAHGPTFPGGWPTGTDALAAVPSVHAAA